MGAFAARDLTGITWMERFARPESAVLWRSGRRSRVGSLGLSILFGVVAPSLPADPAFAEDFPMTRTASGLKYSDIKVGIGDVPQQGTIVTIDYVMATTG